MSSPMPEAVASPPAVAPVIPSGWPPQVDHQTALTMLREMVVGGRLVFDRRNIAERADGSSCSGTDRGAVRFCVVGGLNRISQDSGWWDTTPLLDLIGFGNVGAWIGGGPTSDIVAAIDSALGRAAHLARATGESRG